MKHLRIRRNSFLKQFRNCYQGFADSQHDYAWTTEIFNQKEVQFFNRMTESGFIGQGRFDRYGPLRFGLDHLILDLNFEPEIQTKDKNIESRTEPLLSWDRNFGPEIQIISYSQNFSWFIHPWLTSKTEWHFGKIKILDFSLREKVTPSVTK